MLTEFIETRLRELPLKYFSGIKKSSSFFLVLFIVSNAGFKTKVRTKNCLPSLRWPQSPGWCSYPLLGLSTACRYGQESFRQPPERETNLHGTFGPGVWRRLRRTYVSLMNEVTRAFIATGSLSKELARYHSLFGAIMPWVMCEGWKVELMRSKPGEVQLGRKLSTIPTRDLLAVYMRNSGLSRVRIGDHSPWATSHDKWLIIWRWWLVAHREWLLRWLA